MVGKARLAGWVVIVAMMVLGPMMVASKPDTLRGLAIDVGTEWLKVAVVAPTAGTMQAVEVAVDEQSERRTPALVAFDPPPSATGRLLAGVAAARILTRRPDAVVPSLMRLLGVPLAATSYAQDFAHHLTPSRRLVAVRLLDCLDDKVNVHALMIGLCWLVCRTPNAAVR